MERETGVEPATVQLGKLGTKHDLVSNGLLMEGFWRVNANPLGVRRHQRRIDARSVLASRDILCGPPLGHTLMQNWAKRRITALMSKCPVNILANAWTCDSVLGLRASGCRQCTVIFQRLPLNIWRHHFSDGPTAVGKNRAETVEALLATPPDRGREGTRPLVSRRGTTPATVRQVLGLYRKRSGR
jgi:hypothetical protein